MTNWDLWQGNYLWHEVSRCLKSECAEKDPETPQTLSLTKRNGGKQEIHFLVKKVLVKVGSWRQQVQEGIWDIPLPSNSEIWVCPELSGLLNMAEKPPKGSNQAASDAQISSAHTFQRGAAAVWLWAPNPVSKAERWKLVSTDQIQGLILLVTSQISWSGEGWNIEVPVNQ